DIRSHLFKATPKNPSHLRCQSAAIGRRLRLLRAHRIIRKIPRTHRYILTPHGRNLVTALLAAQHADTQKLTALAARESSLITSKLPDSGTRFFPDRAGKKRFFFEEQPEVC